MTVYITLLGLVGGTVIGFLTGVVTTYVRVPVTVKTMALALITIVVFYFLAQAASWVGTNYLGNVPDWAWRSGQLLLVLLVAWRFAAHIPMALSFLAQLYILVIRGTPIVVQVMFIYFALPCRWLWVGVLMPSSLLFLLLS